MRALTTARQPQRGPEPSNSRPSEIEPGRPTAVVKREGRVWTAAEWRGRRDIIATLRQNMMVLRSGKRGNHNHRLLPRPVNNLGWRDHPNAQLFEIVRLGNNRGECNRERQRSLGRRSRAALQSAAGCGPGNDLQLVGLLHRRQYRRRLEKKFAKHHDHLPRYARCVYEFGFRQRQQRYRRRPNRLRLSVRWQLGGWPL